MGVKLKLNSNKKDLPDNQKDKEEKKDNTGEIFTESVKLDYFRKPDNSKSKALKYLLNILVLIFLVMYSLMLSFTIESRQNYGVPTFAGIAYWQYTSGVPKIIEQGSNNDMASFDVKAEPEAYAIFGYKKLNADTNKMDVLVDKIQSIDNSTNKVTFANGDTANAKDIVGKFIKVEPTTFLYNMMTVKGTFIYWCLFPVIIFFIVAGTSYFILYPRKVKLNFFEQMFNGDNDAALTSSLNTNTTATPVVEEVESDDTISPYMPDEDDLPIAGTDIETFYTTTKAKGGELFALVKKYQDSISELQEFGATDMDLIRMNMVGNSEFNALLTTAHREKPMTLEEIVGYISSFDNVYCIKKRGAINWTYKYKSKTVMIVRGNNNEFKVSFKVYPDAAEKLNRVYCALEDSSFPSGPYWFMFNDLKNLSAPVAKWLIKESYIISMLQEKKAELVRTDKTCSDLGIDVAEIKAQIDSGVNILTYDKFAVVAHKIDKAKITLTTLLDVQIPGLFVDDYVKEVFYIVNGRDDLALSLLFTKGASEQLINALCMEIENACSTAGSSQNDVLPFAESSKKRDSAPVKVVKKQPIKKR